MYVVFSPLPPPLQSCPGKSGGKIYIFSDEIFENFDEQYRKSNIEQFSTI